MIKLINKKQIDNNLFNLKGVFYGDQNNMRIIHDKFYITYDFKTKTSYIYLGKKELFVEKDLKELIEKIIDQNQTGFNIILESFVNEVVTEIKLIEKLTYYGLYKMHIIWNKKTGKNVIKSPKPINLVGDIAHNFNYQKAKIEAMNVNLVRNLQMMPHNRLNSEIYEMYIKKMFEKIHNIEIKVLTMDELKTNNMNLFLGVNAGSAYQPKCIVVSYKGDPQSKEHLVYVGKGITFDSGGMNIKTKSMQGMKYDMSGSAIVAGAIRVIANLKYKTNVSAVLMITDNMISNTAIKPDDVLIASNGISVEINNTDAEGRLVLADGLVYAWKNLNATKIVDVATLTGAMKVSLGNTFTGVWSSDEQEWIKFSKAAEKSGELIWRMPFHKDYLKYMKGSKVADLKNTCLDIMQGGSCTAAQFLKEFSNKIPHIHLDVAATASVDGVATGVMLKTLAEYSIQK